MPGASQGSEERSTSEQKQPLQDRSPAQAPQPCSCIPGTHSLDHCRQQSLRLPVCPTNHDKKVSTYFTTEHTFLSAKCVPCFSWWLKTSWCSILSNHFLWNCTHARTVPSPIVVQRSVINSFARTLPRKEFCNIGRLHNRLKKYGLQNKSIGTGKLHYHTTTCMIPLSRSTDPIDIAKAHPLS